MKFLENISYTNIDAGIEYLKNHSFNNHLPNNEHTIYHVYWYGKINRHQLCCMYSYLYSQGIYNESSQYEIKANISHETDIYITNIDNTSDREKITSTIG